ncbi:hypothetical protein LCGC14_1264370 [marine sediment metagenome]|uniref:Uncharacterized protein n=1 Tax=marine sediment metagenome TaxID=412755 RepID=A0A0F9L261_9ZZZZ
MISRRAFFTFLAGGAALLAAPLFAESPVEWQRTAQFGDLLDIRFQKVFDDNVVTGTTIIPFDYDLHRFGDSDGFGDGVWVDVPTPSHN